MSITQWFNSIVPQKEDAAWNFRAKVFMAFALSLSVVGSTYNLVYFRVGNAYGGAAIAMEAAFLLVMVRYFHKTGNLEKAANWSIIGYCTMMFIILISSGGSSFSASPWWVVAPVFITLVNGLEHGKRFFYLSLGVLIGAYIADFFMDFPDFVSKTPEAILADPAVVNWITFLDWFHYVGVVLYIGLMAFMFAFINGQAMAEAQASLLKAESAKAEADSQKEYLESSVARILREMHLLAKGDLTTRLRVNNDDAIGRLCAGYNEAVEQIQSALSEISSTVNETTDSSNLIAKSTTQLASGTQSQIKDMNDITDAVGSMVASITQNADSATHSSEAARNNGRIAREGGMVVQETVTKIDEIATVVDQSSKSIQQLAVSSKEIGEIVGVIQDIASKTNLLALNASIEAAHAGDAGRGFGVIADEVKDLANQTAQATEKITHMIQNIQSETSDVIQDMNQGLAQVDQGKVLASQAGVSLEEIVSSSENLIVLVEQIALACEEQSRQSQEFMDRIGTMKQVTDTSGREIQGIAGETVHMEELAARVAQRLAAFKVAEA